MSDYYRRFDTVHDGGLLSKGGLLNENKTPRTNPSESAATRTPSNNGEAKVYFRYKLSPAHTVTIECDLSPGFKLDETTHRLVQGHVRLRCPMPDCPGWMHVWSHNKTIFCHPTGLGRRHVFNEQDGFDGNYILPVITIHEPVKCNYRERRKGPDGFEGCRWHGVIADGTAYDYTPRLDQGLALTPSGLSVPVVVHDETLFSPSHQGTAAPTEAADAAAPQEATAEQPPAA